MVDPEAVRSVIRQRRETAEANPSRNWRAIENEDITAVVSDVVAHKLLIDCATHSTPDERASEHIAANDPAAVIALCDGAEKLMKLADDLRHFDPDTTEFHAALFMYSSLAAMFGVTQEGTP